MGSPMLGFAAVKRRQASNSPRDEIHKPERAGGKREARTSMVAGNLGERFVAVWITPQYLINPELPCGSRRARAKRQTGPPEEPTVEFPRLLGVERIRSIPRCFRNSSTCSSFHFEPSAHRSRRRRGHRPTPTPLSRRSVPRLAFRPSWGLRVQRVRQTMQPPNRRTAAPHQAETSPPASGRCSP